LKRRNFLQSSAALIACPILSKANTQWNRTLLHAKGEKYWQHIANEFVINQTKNKVLNFNSGSAGTITKTSYDQLCSHIKKFNQTSFYKADAEFKLKRNEIKNQLANLLDANTNEIALVRNTTEAINNVLNGFPFQKNDEVIYAAHDYPFVINTVEKLKEQKGIKTQKLTIDLNQSSNQQIIEQYKKLLNANTKLLILSHVSFREGRILPVAEITKLAHINNTKVLVDGAHSFAQINFSLKKINCDYYATSLHKWLCAPHGNGLLFIKENLISEINPINNAYLAVKNTTEKFEQLGTMAFYNQTGIDAAIQFHQLIGIDKKQERLYDLSKHLIKKAGKIKGLNCISNIQKDNYCAITNISAKQIEHKQLVSELYSKYGIITKSIYLQTGAALRLSTNIFLTKNDIDTFCSAIKTLV